MIKTCERCRREYGVFHTGKSQIKDPWYCPNCENKKDVPTEKETIALKAENASLRTTAELAGRMEEALDWLQWSGTHVEGDSHTENPSITGCVCPDCYNREKDGHKPDCELGQLLADIQRARGHFQGQNGPVTREKWYDEYIAPRLLEIARECETEGMGFVAVVEYEPENRGETVALPEDAGLAMRLLHLCAKAGENIDSYLIAVIKYAKHVGISLSQSLFLRKYAEQEEGVADDHDHQIPV